MISLIYVFNIYRLEIKIYTISPHFVRGLSQNNLTKSNPGSLSIYINVISYWSTESYLP